MPEIDFYDKAKIIDEALTSGVVKSIVINLIRSTPYNDYFFRRVTSIGWFIALKNEGYFKPEKKPSPAPADQEGYYSIPEWNVLPYLERVSQQVNAPGNEKHVDDLLAIIKEVSNYKDASGNHIDNYRTWYYFAKILCNLPTEKIAEETINFIPIWLDSKFSTSLPGAEIAGKLSPKFLNSDKPEDWKKAERLIEIITDIKWVPIPEKQRGLSERDIEAITLIEPHWLRKGFEKNFERIGTVCSIRAIETIAKRVLSIFSKQYDHSYYDVDYEDKKYEITHALLESGQHQISVHSLKYPEDWDGFSRNKIEKTLVTSFVLSDLENKTAFVAKVEEGLIKNVFSSLSTDLDEAVSSIYSLHDYTYIRYNLFNASPDNIRIDDTEKILIYILKEILAVKAQHNREETSKVLDKFLSRKYPYPLFKRLVLFVAGREWDKYKEYFFKVIDLEEIRCFEESDYATELSILLKNNFRKFSSDEKEIIKNIIVTGPELLPPENPEKNKAYWKQKWLSLMKDDPLFASLYEEQKKATGIEEEKFTFGAEFKTSEGFGPSPLSAEEILNLTNADLAMKLKEFRSEKKWEGMTVAGLSVALKEAIMANPDKFTENLSDVKDVGFIYVYKILDGLKDTWKTKKTIDWGKVFDFIALYIKKDQFWKDDLVVEKDEWLGGANHEWVTGIIAELIQEGTRDDAWAFSEDYFDMAREIIFALIREPEEDKEITDTDYVTYSLNTPRGKLITALVYLALRIARVNEKKGVKAEPRWSDVYKEKFDEILNKKIIEAYVSLGRFLPYLAHLDKEWANGKIEQVISEKDTKYWQAFMEGYLSIGRVNDDLYALMRPHYEHGFSCEFKERHDREYLIQHICIGYLRGHEKLDDPNSLFKKIVDEWRPEQIREVIGFFWMQRGILTESTEENEKIRAKILEFWRFLNEKYKGKDEGALTQDDKHILSAVSKLAAFLLKIDTESYEWLMLSSPYAHEDFNSPFFIEYLDELKDKGDRGETAKYIGDVYLKMLDKIRPDYDQAHIRSIVEFLYDAGAKGSANKICNIYGSRGHEFLRDLYEGHSNRT